METLNFNVDLIEETKSWYFAIDSHDREESLYKKQTGLLQRKLQDERTSKAMELNTVSDAKHFIGTPVTAAALKIRDKNITFNPARFLRENEPVIDTLNELKPMEWRMIFRANHTGRVIIANEKKEKKSDFTYYSLLVKLRLKDRRDFIEVGEGSVQALKFNQDGLVSRIKKIVANHKERKLIKFREKLPVVLNSGDGAVLFHELLGHTLEADYIYRKQSPVTVADIGKQIVSKNVTLVTQYGDDAFFKEVSCDDEGENATSPVLIQKGVLRQLISDSFYKNKLNIDHCGHCRLEDFTRPPMPRMYALYLEPGPYHPQELMDSTKYGVYAGEFGDGKIYFHKHLFYFYIRDARLIENGKLTTPLGSIMVQGNISETLNSIAMVANDFRFDKGISYCFKKGQTVNVRVGQPTVKINNLSITPYTGTQ
ncbi:MAG: TldD/PmbA family protein [bacterium]|nr:TldD/PmbA family protein [bacterium]